MATDNNTADPDAFSATKSRANVKLLLIQFRDDPVIKQKEYDSFVRFSKLRPEQVISFDALNNEITTEIIKGHDGLIIAGTGDTSVNDEGIKYTEPLRALLRHVYEINFPTLAVCFGAQHAAIEFGGKVERKEAMRETGTYPMYLTKEGKADPMYQGIAEIFNGQMGHNDTITVLPPGAVHLTFSDRTTNQAFRFPDKPFYAVQYHPELDEDEIKFRFEYYKKFYADNMDEFKKIIDNIQESTDASQLLTAFVDVVVVPG